MLISLIVATFTLGLNQGKTMKELAIIFTDAVKDVSMILLIVAGSGAFKAVLTDSGANNDIAAFLHGFHLQPLVLRDGSSRPSSELSLGSAQRLRV